MNGTTLPPWLRDVAKYGGWSGVVLVVWFMFLAPMREDFIEFKIDMKTSLTTVANQFGQKADKLSAEVAAIRELLGNEILQRITRNEQRDMEIMRRLDKIEEAMKR